MSLIKVLYISAFIFLKPLPSVDLSQSEECDELTVKASITYAVESGAKVEIEAKGGITPYKYVFYKPSGHLLTEDFDSNTISKLPKGKYHCTVIAQKGCYKSIEIEIK